MYGLFTAALTMKDKRRIDGFQTHYLKKILKIAHPYYNRIFNNTVLQIACAEPLNKKILQQQVKYISKLAERDHDDPTRNCVFKPDSIELIKNSARGRGRPRLKWSTDCLLYTSPSPRDATLSRMPSSA